MLSVRRRAAACLMPPPLHQPLPFIMRTMRLQTGAAYALAAQMVKSSAVGMPGCFLGALFTQLTQMGLSQQPYAGMLLRQTVHMAARPHSACCRHLMRLVLNDCQGGVQGDVAAMAAAATLVSQLGAARR
mmetsp:Transcript_14572/g.36247  ORF Transcript_14572/g.36247 Transcript_14572/m.36247 type:complete len:130 (-) Transcript_14572:362-751(-)